ncbi:glycosyltransferase family 4 protein [bacterium]|nr:glycosyltransferase family 4 protein [bacterium]
MSILRADRSISGMAMRFVALWAYLARERPHQDVWLFSNESLLDRLLGPTVRPTRVISFEDRGPFYLLRRVWSLAKFLFSLVYLRVDTVHLVAGGADFLAVMPLLRLLRVKVCLTFATAALEVGLEGQALQRVRYALRSAPNVEFLNPVARVPDFPQQRFYSPCSFPYILGLGRSIQAKTPELRRNLVVFSGSLIPGKNPLLALQGFEAFLRAEGDSWPDLELVFVGQGVLREKIEARMLEVNLLAGRSAVRFAPDSRLFELLAEARVFLSLQEPDNYPSQSLMEAMLYENCVIATDVGETRRIVPLAGNELIQPKVEALAQALSRILRGPKSNTENAQFIRLHHSPERFAEYFLQIHQQLV